MAWVHIYDEVTLLVMSRMICTFSLILIKCVFCRYDTDPQFSSWLMQVRIDGGHCVNRCVCCVSIPHITCVLPPLHA